MHKPVPRPRRALFRVLVMAGVAALLAVLVPSPASAASGDDITSGLIARYKLDETSGTTAVNSAPASRFGNGVVDGTASWGGAQGFSFSGGANGSGNAIRLPNDLNAGLTSISVDFDVKIAPEQANYYMIYAIGNRASDGAGERYLFSSGDSFHTVITAGRQQQEINIQPSSNATLQRGLWKHVTYTQTGTTGILYEDGVERARNTSVTTAPSALGTTVFNYLGRSTYQADPSFQGRLRDFRIYDRALAPAEVTTLATDVLHEAAQTDAAAIDLGSLSSVTAPLTLPSSGANGTSITWATSDASVVTATGAVQRGPEGSAPASAVLTATVRRGGDTVTRAFTVTVAPRNDAADAAAAAAAIVVPHLADVRENLTLPATAGAGTVSWVSSAPAMIASDGRVTRPANGQADATVQLDATVKIGTATSTRRFTATVRALPKVEETKAYLFPYFTGEGNAEDEKVRYGLSKGNNALDWTTVNDDKPILSSTLGEKGLRDPFIMRSPQGDRFYLIATDLNAYRTGLDQSQVFGSRYMEVWESTDLVNWGQQRHVLVSAPEAGNTWAPEAYYDTATGQYIVYWASNLYPSGDTSVARDANTSYNRMMYATTRDFVTFSTPKVWIDDKQPGQGNGTIDSSMIKEDGWVYRFTVTEGSNIPRVDRTKDITATITPGNNPWLGQGAGSAWEPRQSAVGYGQTYTGTSGRRLTFDEGEGTTMFRPNRGDANGDTGVYVFIDQAPYYGGDGYVPFHASSMAAGDWTLVQNRNLPDSARHGTVLPVTTAEYERILAAYQPDRLITTTDVALTTTPGVQPALPATVAAVQGVGTASQKDLGAAPVRWDSVAIGDVKAGAVLRVTGAVGDGGLVTATVTVVDSSSTTVAPRCLAGKVSLGITTVNRSGARATIALTSAYGTKTFTDVAPGASVFHSFTTRTAQLPAGSVSVSVTPAGGSAVTSATAYPAATC
ncbi:MULTISPECIES: immunoglobulin-like domain-containing protein [unclassified Rathayibacter]|uniref:immunoglobulin-like domain-containing protein n=1 Tax=unclassified Rathayibacter TaxID=2609250 RepID=UPI001889E23E|nr:MULTISPECIES: immunoglobulin-like domain-containing protein [unclassified Rathayibacter]MBF4462918.1 family 43 glycosylhydrolase [Rathayibacter sp. VKM Ac-2879]MBF4504332.1 family 43 glycosylhydrolase [Rathayibacter sp. VKM Ac-2878]